MVPESGPPGDGKVKVLFIAGTGRSGSTLLASLLGQLPGYFVGGELRFVWGRGIVANRLCGCGLAFDRCPEWGSILGTPLLVSGRDWSGVAQRLEGSLRARTLPRLLIRRTQVSRWPAETVALLQELYLSIQHQTGCRVIVDSSKLPSYGWLLGACPPLDIYVVHLVRDSRAVAFSWSRTRELPDVAGYRLMQQRSPLWSTLDWILWNGVAEAIWSQRAGRYLRLRYEDLVTEPMRALRDVATMLGEPAPADSMVAGGRVNLKPLHSVAGNPARMRHGSVEIRPDLEWTQSLPPHRRAVVTALSAPLLRHYGYRLRVRENIW